MSLAFAEVVGMVRDDDPLQACEALATALPEEYLQEFHHRTFPADGPRLCEHDVDQLALLDRIGDRSFCRTKSFMTDAHLVTAAAA